MGMTSIYFNYLGTEILLDANLIRAEGIKWNNKN